LLVRHLVLPENKAGTKQVMHFIAHEISENTYVNVMAQYYPCGQVDEILWLQRRINRQEYASAVQSAIKAGLQRIEYQSDFLD
jgi:putative pyruvate formate lyase activating enzyme